MKFSQCTHNEELFDPTLEFLHEELLTTLKLSGPLPVEELVTQLSKFRWVDVLKGISWLWGKGQLELGQDSGRLKLWSLENDETMRCIDGETIKKSHNIAELTVS